MATLKDFVLMDNLFVAQVTLAKDTYVNVRLLKKGCIYAGSYVMSLVHPDKINAYNINIFYPKKVKFENLLRKDHFEMIYKSVTFTRMDIVLGANISRKKDLIVYNISTSLSNYDLVYEFDDHVDLDKCASRIYYNYSQKRVELAIPVDELNDPYSILLNWNYKLRMDEDVIAARFNKYSNRNFLITEYQESNVEACFICKELTNENTLRTRCCNNIYHQSCMNRWNDCEPGLELTENKCKCPMCRTINIHSICPFIVCVNFKKWKIVKCYDCYVLFPHNLNLPHSMYCYDCC